MDTSHQHIMHLMIILISQYASRMVIPLSTVTCNEQVEDDLLGKCPGRRKVHSSL